jgi:hypothetical protein
MNSFTSFDGIQIAFRDFGEGPVIILLHGGDIDALGQPEAIHSSGVGTPLQVQIA